LANIQIFIIGANIQGNVHWIVPCPINSLFTGCGELLYRIQKAIYSDYTSSPDMQKRFVISSLGRLGKSEICLQVASQIREEYNISIPLILLSILTNNLNQ
jgi:hypothetical protein